MEPLFPSVKRCPLFGVSFNGSTVYIVYTYVCGYVLRGCLRFICTYVTVAVVSGLRSETSDHSSDDMCVHVIVNQIT